MEGGVGSRLSGRSSSRYGTTTPASTTTIPVFTGPVRKWRRQWVTSEPTTNNNNNNNNNRGGKHHDARPLLLCRWIPLPSTASAADSDLPPKRKVRYAPVTVLEELKKEVACTAAGVDANKVKKFEANRTERSDAAAVAAFGKSHNTDAFLQDMKELMMGHVQVNQHHQLFLDKF